MCKAIALEAGSNTRCSKSLSYRSTVLMRCSAFSHRYFLYLLVNVVFIFLFASTYWQLVRDLANSPAKIPEKLAAALQKGNAR